MPHSPCPRRTQLLRAQICESANLPYDRLPSFLGGGFDWEAEWIPEHVRQAGREGARARAARRGQHAEPAAAEPAAPGAAASEQLVGGAERAEATSSGAEEVGSTSAAPAAALASASAAEAQTVGAPQLREWARARVVVALLVRYAPRGPPRRPRSGRPPYAPCASTALL